MRAKPGFSSRPSWDFHRSGGSFPPESVPHMTDILTYVYSDSRTFLCHFPWRNVLFFYFFYLLILHTISNAIHCTNVSTAIASSQRHPAVFIVFVKKLSHNCWKCKKLSIINDISFSLASIFAIEDVPMRGRLWKKMDRAFTDGSSGYSTVDIMRKSAFTSFRLSPSYNRSAIRRTRRPVPPSPSMRVHTTHCIIEYTLV